MICLWETENVQHDNRFYFSSFWSSLSLSISKNSSIWKNKRIHPLTIIFMNHRKYRFKVKEFSSIVQVNVSKSSGLKSRRKQKNAKRMVWGSFEIPFSLSVSDDCWRRTRGREALSTNDLDQLKGRKSSNHTLFYWWLTMTITFPIYDITNIAISLTKP